MLVEILIYNYFLLLDKIDENVLGVLLLIYRKLAQILLNLDNFVG